MMLTTVETLREIGRRCRSGEPLTREHATWLGTALNSFLEHRCRSLHDAFGLRFPQGGIPWWMEQAIRERDASLRALAACLPTVPSKSEKARRIHTFATRYAASAWLHDRNREELPARYVGTPKEHLWRAFKSGAAMPLGERQLRNILAE